MTLFSKKLMVKAAFSAALVLGLVNCADEPVKIKEVVEAIPDVVRPAVDHVVPEVIYFDFDKSQIRPEHQRKLEAFAEHLRGNNAVVQIEGHCDERGTIEYNLALGERRKMKIKQNAISFLQIIFLSREKIWNST